MVEPLAFNAKLSGLRIDTPGSRLRPESGQQPAGADHPWKAIERMVAMQTHGHVRG
jgi:hypothetical protein